MLDNNFALLFIQNFSTLSSNHKSLYYHRSLTITTVDQKLFNPFSNYVLTRYTVKLQKIGSNSVYVSCSSNQTIPVKITEKQRNKKKMSSLHF